MQAQYTGLVSWVIISTFHLGWKVWTGKCILVKGVSKQPLLLLSSILSREKQARHNRHTNTHNLCKFQLIWTIFWKNYTKKSMNLPNFLEFFGAAIYKTQTLLLWLRNWLNMSTTERVFKNRVSSKLDLQICKLSLTKQTQTKQILCKIIWICSQHYSEIDQTWVGRSRKIWVLQSLSGMFDLLFLIYYSRRTWRTSMIDFEMDQTWAGHGRSEFHRAWQVFSDP